MMKTLISVLLFLTIISCSSRIEQFAELQQGKRYFNSGYYKSALRDLLPLAVDGNVEAQYAVGYMYYYGAGVTQDTEVGYFWIHRAAKQHYQPAIKALTMITKNKVRKKR